MNEETRRRLESLESLLEQRKRIEEQLDLLLNPPLNQEEKTQASSHPRLLIPTLHTYVEDMLRTHPAGLTTDEVYAEIHRLHPEMALTQHDTTASLVYLTHKRQTAERIGQGRYRFRST